MSDETKNTGGPVDTAKSTTETSTESSTPAGSDSTASRNVEDRIAGLVAERNRLKDNYDELDSRFKELEKKHKTEEEKRLDAIREETRNQVIQSEVEPLKQRLTDTEVALTTHLNAKLERIPEEHRALVPESLPLHERFLQADRVLATLASGKNASLGASANPDGEDKPKIIAGTEYRRWTQLDQYKPETKEEYENHKVEMIAARKEGRIDWNR